MAAHPTPLPLDPDEARLLFEAAGDAVLLVDLASGRILTANPESENVLDRPAAVLETTSFWDLIEPADHQALSDLVRRTEQSGQADLDTVLQYRHPDGRTIPSRARITVVATGAEGRALVLIRDLTQTEEARKRLQEAEGRYQAVFEAAWDPLFLVDADGLFLAANGAAARAMGREVGNLVGRRMHEIFPAEVADRQVAAVRRALGTGSPLEGAESVVPTASGPRWYNTSLTPVEGVEGGPACVLGIARDVTGRRAAEEALRESEARYRAVVESQTEFVTRFRPDGTVTFVNEANCRYFGLSPEQYTSGTFRRLLFPEDYDRLMESLASLTPDRPTFTAEHRIKRGPEVRWTQWTNRAFFDDEGRVVEYQGVGRDITERKRLEERLLEARKMEAVGQLAGGIAHDFNNLVTGILCHLELLKEALDPDAPGRDSVGVIDAAARRASHLTNQLLGFARRGKRESVPFDLADVVDEVIALAGRSFDPGIAVHRSGHGAAPRVLGDPDQIEQVVLNLALNARDAMPEGGTLTFAFKSFICNELTSRDRPECRPGRYVVLVVSDTGGGIDPEVRPHVFEPFFTTKGRGKGTGMGLAMVYGIVRNHGGWVEVESESGCGAEFRVYLPAAAPSDG